MGWASWTNKNGRAWGPPTFISLPPGWGCSVTSCHVPLQQQSHTDAIYSLNFEGKINLSSNLHFISYLGRCDEEEAHKLLYLRHPQARLRWSAQYRALVWRTVSSPPTLLSTWLWCEGLHLLGRKVTHSLDQKKGLFGVGSTEGLRVSRCGLKSLRWSVHFPIFLSVCISFPSESLSKRSALLDKRGDALCSDCV